MLEFNDFLIGLLISLGISLFERIAPSVESAVKSVADTVEALVFRFLKMEGAGKGFINFLISLGTMGGTYLVALIPGGMEAFTLDAAGIKALIGEAAPYVVSAVGLYRFIPPKVYEILDALVGLFKREPAAA